METLTVQQIIEYADGQLLRGDLSRLVTAFSADSRTVRAGEMFVALRGENFDGHDHTYAAAAKGAVGAIVDAPVVLHNLPTEFALINVGDTLAAYQAIATIYRKSLPMKVIGITGSNGKTSTKDLTAAVLSKRFRVLKTEGNLNNHIGVPKMLLQADRSHEVAVLEMGMNHPGEIAPLARMAAPDVAIITNIGRAHLEFMGSREAIAQEKGMLAEAVAPTGTVILNGTDEFTPSIVRRTRARVVTVGSEIGTLCVNSVVQDFDGSRFVLVAGGEELPVKLPIAGHHMILNSLLAVAAGRAMDISLDDCIAALADAKLTKGRLERKKIRGRLVLDDSYNANPDSMGAALETLASLPTAHRRIAVLGKMGELGDAAEDGYQTVGKLAATKKIDCLITVGEEARSMNSAAQDAGMEDTIHVANTEEAAQQLEQISCPGDLILVKGSRSAGMERMLATFAAHSSRPAEDGTQELEVRSISQ